MGLLGIGKKEEEQQIQSKQDQERVISVIDDQAVRSAMDAVPHGSAGQEPILAQLDEWSRTQIISLIYNTTEIVDPNTGEKMRVITKIKYPELHELSGYALSHLNLMVNLTWEDSRAMLIDFWSGDYKRLKEMYYDNDEALYILRAIYNVFTRNVKAAVDGTQQDYASMYSGGKRELNVRHHRPDEPQ